MSNYTSSIGARYISPPKLFINIVKSHNATFFIVIRVVQINPPKKIYSDAATMLSKGKAVKVLEPETTICIMRRTFNKMTSSKKIESRVTKTQKSFQSCHMNQQFQLNSIRFHICLTANVGRDVRACGIRLRLHLRRHLTSSSWCGTGSQNNVVIIKPQEHRILVI